MTVAELRYVLRDANDDAEIVIVDGDGGYAFGPDAVFTTGQTVRGRPVVVIDLTAGDCTAVG